MKRAELDANRGPGCLAPSAASGLPPRLALPLCHTLSSTQLRWPSPSRAQPSLLTPSTPPQAPLSARSALTTAPSPAEAPAPARIVCQHNCDPPRGPLPRWKVRYLAIPGHAALTLPCLLRSGKLTMPCFAWDPVCIVPRSVLSISSAHAYERILPRGAHSPPQMHIRIVSLDQCLA